MVSHWLHSPCFLELRTISERSQFCSTVILINGPDQSFEYIACGAEARTDKLFPAPNVAVQTTVLSTIPSPSSSSTSPASLPTVTVVETSSFPASSSSSATSSSSNSLTSASISAPSTQEPTNVGAIVGGVIGGLIVVCLTILGTVLIRRKHGVKGQVVSPPGRDHHGWNEFVDGTTLHARNSGDTKNNYHWGSIHDPVEMYSGHHVNMEPVELSEQVQIMDTPKR